MPSLILISNVILMFLFWCACLLVVTPAYNQFIQYGNSGNVLPAFTQLVIDSRFFSFLVPILWAAFSFKIHKIIQKKKKIEEQIQALLLYSLVTIAGGLLLIIFVTLAGILPYLQIGSAL